MSDPTEATRRQLVAQINAVSGSREALEAQHGQVWDTSQLCDDFEVLGFAAPLVVVRRRAERRERKPHVSALTSVLLRIRAGLTVVLIVFHTYQLRSVPCKSTVCLTTFGW